MLLQKKDPFCLDEELVLLVEEKNVMGEVIMQEARAW